MNDRDIVIDDDTDLVEEGRELLEHIKKKGETDPHSKRFYDELIQEAIDNLPPDTVTGQALAIALLDKVATMHQTNPTKAGDYAVELKIYLERIYRDDEAIAAINEYTIYLNDRINDGTITDKEYTRYNVTNQFNG